MWKNFCNGHRENLKRTQLGPKFLTIIFLCVCKIYYCLSVNQCLRVAPKYWWTPFLCAFFLYFLCLFFFFSFFDWKRQKNLFKCWKSLFQPTNSVWSTCLLVKIHNIQGYTFQFDKTKTPTKYRFLNSNLWKNGMRNLEQKMTPMVMN